MLTLILSVSVQRRSKLEIFFDILYAINSEYSSGVVKPTRIQLHVRMSYDKLMRHLKELDEKNFIKMNPLSITEKGGKFLQDYSVVTESVSIMKNKYLKEEIEIEKKSFPYRILIVDDNEDMRDMLDGMITHFGYKTSQAKNGKQAIFEYENSKPDLVLMDINMPVKDGYDTFFDIREKFPTARVIFMTGYKDFSKWKKAKNKGAIYLIQKPIPPIFLKELISRHVKEIIE